MRTTFSTLALALALLLVSPVASAQSADGCATLTVSHLAPAEFEPGASQTISFEVRNNAQFSEVTARIAANLPDAGWSVEPLEQTAQVAAGTSTTVEFTVVAPNVRDAETTLNVVASGTCTVNGQTVPLPGETMRVPDSPDSVPLQVAGTSGITFPAITDVPPAYFFGGLGAIVVVLGAVLAARRRSGGFEVRSPEPEKGVRPGRGASFPLEVANKGAQPDTATFEVGDVPVGWTAFMALPDLTLAPGEARTLWLMVRAPPTADDGSATVVPVVVRSREHPRRESRVAVRAVVRPEAEDAAGSVEATRLG